MPKIVDKVSCLSGHVLLYGSGTSSGKWFYREWDSVAKKYRQKQITGAANVDEAVKGAIDIAFVIKQEVESGRATLPSGKTVLVKKIATNSRRSRQPAKETISHAVEQFIASEREKAAAGLLEPATVSHKAAILRLHMIPYLSDQGIYYTDQLNLESFHGYPVYRQETTKLNLQQELKRIKHWVTSYLVRKRLGNSL